MKSTLLKTLPLLALTILLLSCGEKKESAQELSSGLLLDNIDSTINPGDNFQLYVNGKWIKNTEIPADKSSYGVGSMVHEKSQDDVKKIIEESAAANKPAGTDEQKVGDLYASYMDMKKRDEMGVAPLAPDFQKIDAIKNPRF